MFDLLHRLLAVCVPLVGLLGAPAGARAQDPPQPRVETKVETKVEATKRPFLWRIETEPPSFVFGTIHLADPRVTTLPEAVTRALESSDVLLTEIELGPATQAEAQAAMLLPEGTSLKDVLPAELHTRLGKYLQARGMPIAAFARSKPWTLLPLLPLLDDRSVMQGKALDVRLVELAKARRIETGALETLAEQLGVFEAFTHAEQARMLEAGLGMLEQAAAEKRKPIEELIATYVSGDLAALEALMDDFSGFDVDDEELEQRLEKLLLTDRNHKMADRLVTKLRSKPARAWFVAVGALHCPGEEGLLALLQRGGFATVRVEGASAGVPAEGKKEPVGAGRGR